MPPLSRPALLLAAALLTAAPAAAAELAPHQQAALDRLAAAAPAAERDAIRSQFAPIYAMADQKTAASMTDGYLSLMKQGFSLVSQPDNGYEMTEADQDFHNKQLDEPLRRAWQARMEFEDLLAAKQRNVDQGLAGLRSQFRHKLAGIEGFRLESFGGTGYAAEILRDSLRAKIDSRLPRDGRYRFDAAALPARYDHQPVLRRIDEEFGKLAALAQAYDEEMRAAFAVTYGDETGFNSEMGVSSAKRDRAVAAIDSRRRAELGRIIAAAKAAVEDHRLAIDDSLTPMIRSAKRIKP